MTASNVTSGSTVIASMRCRDAPGAIDWLCNTLGFARHAVYEKPGGIVEHAELTLGNGMVMLGSASNGGPMAELLAHPQDFGGRVTSVFYVVVPDCGPVYARAQAAGSDIQAELRTMDYGGQAFSVRDPEGYLWSLGEYDPWDTDAK